MKEKLRIRTARTSMIYVCVHASVCACVCACMCVYVGGGGKIAM